MSDASYSILVEADYIRMGLICSGCGAWTPKYDCSQCEAPLCSRCGWVLPRDKQLYCESCYERRASHAGG